MKRKKDSCPFDVEALENQMAQLKFNELNGISDEVKDKVFDDMLLWGVGAYKTELENGQPIVKYVDPISPEMQAVIYNAEHSDSQTIVEQLTIDQIRKYPLLPSDCYPVTIEGDKK